jgi:archaellum component FlaF (FlaF/FlaG flagellin family)
MVYTLKPIMDSLNVPLIYSGNATFSNPVPSSSGVQLNTKTGQLTFTPNSFVSGSQPAANEYAVLVEIAEFRRINGVSTKVGSSQRLTTINVVNNASIVNPEILNATVNGQPIQANSIIEAIDGATLTFQFNTADANVGDSVKFIFPNTSNNFSTTGGNRPTGTFIIQAGKISNSDQVIYFPVTVKDNACPVPGVTTQIYGIKILANPMGLKKHLDLDANFIAYPNPFAEEITFKYDSKVKAEGILIYNLLGQQVDQILLQNIESGEQKVNWINASNFASGTYIAKLITSENSVQTLKFTKLQ